MECPFPLDFDDLMDAEDYLHDEDEKHMHRFKPPEDNPYPGFNVEIKLPHRSVFEDKYAEKAKLEKEEKKKKEVTIDDDEPDFEPEDEYGRSRIHAWVLILSGEREI